MRRRLLLQRGTERVTMTGTTADTSPQRSKYSKGKTARFYKIQKDKLVEAIVLIREVAPWLFDDSIVPKERKEVTALFIQLSKKLHVL
jgi:hypothetical protein